MNTKHLTDLSARLSQAIDQNYDVVNMDAVISVIAALEGATITKEQLEATKLAKNINHLRRRTKNEHLARRAKTLLRRWREMVGLPQPSKNLSTAIAGNTNTNIAITVNDNAVQYNQQQHHNHQLQQDHHYSSTMSINLVDSPGDATVSSNLTRSANIYNTNKRLENVDEDSRGIEVGGMEGGSRIYTPTSVVPTVDVDSNKVQHAIPKLFNFGTVPKHFWHNEQSALSTYTLNTNAQSNGKQRNAGRKKSSAASLRSKPERNAEPTKFDQSSNFTSSDPNTFASSINNNVVIDIQDSNSGSNLITPSTKLQEAQQQQYTNETSSITSGTLLKSRKVRKEKRRKDRDFIDAIDSDAPVVIIDDPPTTTLNIQQPMHPNPNNLQEINGNTMKKEKNNSAYPMSNISEILSLSNSSMSSIFPSDGTLKHVDDMVRSDVSVSSRSNIPKNLSSSDLSFAGKFKPQLSTIVPTTYINDNSVDVSIISDNSCSTNLPKVNKPLQLSSPKKLSFGQCSNSGIVNCNSNDSTSNSRASHLEVVDITKQNNNQGQQPTVSVESLQQISMPTPQISDATDTNAAAIPEVKVPKKRGRKKGSKGVDSVIAKETSLTTQILMSSLSGSKKVKTTKELYTEMQNRKLGIVTPTPTAINLAGASATTTKAPTAGSRPTQRQIPLQPESSCSDSSLHSPRTLDANSMPATNAAGPPSKNSKKRRNADIADSESESMQSELSVNAGNMVLPLKDHTISVDSVDSNSQLVKHTIETAEGPPSKVVLTQRQIEKQLQECIRRLPPLKSIREIELECAKKIIPCTCKVILALPPLPSAMSPEPIKPEALANEIPAIEEPSNKTTESKSYSIERSSSTASPLPVQSSSNEPKTIDTNDPKIVSLTSMMSETPMESNVTPEKSRITLDESATIQIEDDKSTPKKSIFDLDHDEESDPLTQIKAEAAIIAEEKRKLGSSETIYKELECDYKPSKNEFKKVESLQDSQVASQFMYEPTVHPLQSLFPDVRPEYFFLFPMESFLKTVEDPDCPAKQRFITQTQDITQFHINALHNCYIPNVNGNWDNGDPNQPKKELEGAPFPTTYPPEEAHHHVVPKLGSLWGERLTKNVTRQIQFTRKYKPKPKSKEIIKMHKFQFFGMAPRLEYRKMREVYGRSKQKKKRKKVKKGKTATEMSSRVLKTPIVAGVEKCNYPNISQESEQEGLVGDAVGTEVQEVLSRDMQEFTNNFVNITNSTTYSNNLDSNVLNNNNNKTMKDISIVIGRSSVAIENGTQLPKRNSAGICNENQYQNLLTIVTTMEDNLDLTNTPAPLGGNEKKEITEQTETNQSATLPLATRINNVSHLSPKAEKPFGLDSYLTPSENKDVVELSDNSSSRRSSFDSNTSLKQTQHSINMRLKQHRQQEKKQLQILRRKRKRRHKHRRKLHTDWNAESTTLDERKPPRIKRIKIAINGDFATQRQILTDSSSESSYDDCSEDEDKNYATKDAEIEEDEDGTSSSSSKCTDGSYDMNDKDSGNEMKTKEVDVKMLRKSNVSQMPLKVDATNAVEADIDHDMEVEVEADADADVEAEDDDIDNEFSYFDGYDGNDDYHEIVQREIFASDSFDNKRIVLTIKKTPTKMNLITNALSSSSSDATLSTSELSKADSNLINVIKTDDTFMPTKTKDDIGVAYDVKEDIAIKDKNLDTISSITADAKNDLFNMSTSNNAANKITNATTLTVAAETLIPDAGVKNVKSPIDRHTESKSLAVVKRDKRLLCDSRKTPLSKKLRLGTPKSFLDYLDGTDNATESLKLETKPQKLHQKLFFPYELYIRGKDANIKDSILNVSSCSSCGENDTDIDDELDFESRILIKDDRIVANRISVIEKKNECITVSGDYHATSDSTLCNDCDVNDTILVYQDSSISTMQSNDDYTTTSANDEIEPKAANPATNSAAQSQIAGEALRDCNPPTKVEDEAKAEAETDNREDDGGSDDKELPLCNNGKLLSFNNIYPAPTTKSTVDVGIGSGKDGATDTIAFAILKKQVSMRLNNNDVADNITQKDMIGAGRAEDLMIQKEQQQKQKQEEHFPNENCDEYNNLYNNNNNINSLSNSNIKKDKIENNLSYSLSSKPITAQSVGNSNDGQMVQNVNTMTDKVNLIQSMITVNSDATTNDTKTTRIEKSQEDGGEDHQACPSPKSQPQNQLEPHEEYRLGVRSVDEDVHDDDGNNCARIQEFREWYEVLQLRSYNDELLTVLPYVVLD